MPATAINVSSNGVIMCGIFWKALSGIYAQTSKHRGYISIVYNLTWSENKYLIAQFLVSLTLNIYDC